MPHVPRSLRRLLSWGSVFSILISTLTVLTVATAPARATSCPCTALGSATPVVVDAADPNPVELGVKIRTSVIGDITGVRFYKSAANVGTHTGSLWTADGRLLANGTFTNETATGWQTLIFTNPVPVKANTTYIASYHAPNGHYAADYGFAGAGTGPITALASGVDGDDGVYAYSNPYLNWFPNYSYNSANYWVDAIFDDNGVPTGPPAITATSPTSGSTGAPMATAFVTTTFSAQLDPSTVSYSVTDGSGERVPGYVSFDSALKTVKLEVNTQLALGTTFTVTVQGADAWGHQMPTTQWSFTTTSTPPSYTCSCTIFPTVGGPGGTADNDTDSVELGARFTSAVNGTITGIRMFKTVTTAGTYTGSLWTADGTQLATGTFTNGTSWGWQYLTFATPVPITAGTVYVASYHAPAGRYSYMKNAFSTYPYIQYPLTALISTADHGNGVFRYGAATAFPDNPSDGTDYGVDVLFNVS